MSVAATTTASKPTYKVVDVDTHLSEPHDLWTRRATGKLKEQVPQVRKLGDKLAWVIDGDKSIGDLARPLSSIRRDGTKAVGFDWEGLTFGDVHPSSSYTKDRLQMMDEQGVYAQLLYPNVLGFGGTACAKVSAELRKASTLIYNEAMQEMQEESGKRIFPMAVLPWWDIKSSVQEVERAKKMGLHGITMHQDPHNHVDQDDNPLPNLGDKHWYPLWEACVDLGMPINFHIGTSEQSLNWTGNIGWDTFVPEERGAIGGGFIFLDNGRVMVNLIMSGLLDRYPKLKFVSVESGVGWMPFILQALDYNYNETVTKKRLQLKPSEYFRQNFYATFWFERGIRHTVDWLGIDNCMFETDFPHPSCLYPLGDVAERIGSDFSEKEIQKLVGGNAMRVYNIS